MSALHPTITRLHGGVELRIGSRAAMTAIFLLDADAIDLGTRLVAAGLGISEGETGDLQTCVPPPHEGRG